MEIVLSINHFLIRGGVNRIEAAENQSLRDDLENHSIVPSLDQLRIVSMKHLPKNVMLSLYILRTFPSVVDLAGIALIPRNEKILKCLDS